MKLQKCKPLPILKKRMVMTMERKSIVEIRQMFQSGEIGETDVERFASDERKGVQALITTYYKKKEKERLLYEKYIQMMSYEKACYDRGLQYIAGIDEAGRGPLAGPVVAAAVILPSDFMLPGLNDSKQLNQETRELYYSIIMEKAVSYGIGIMSNEVIDRFNIFEATKMAMHEALSQLQPVPQHILIDAVKLNGLPCSSEAIIKGDSKSVSIAAASILAKVTRDRKMQELHKEYPMYDFASNMGYGTSYHMEKLYAIGASPYHRKSFAPVRKVTG